MVRSPADPNGEVQYVFEKSEKEEWVEVVPYEEPRAEPRNCTQHTLPGVDTRDTWFTIGSIIRTNCCDGYWRLCCIGSFGLMTWELVEWVEAGFETQAGWHPVKTKLGFRVKNR